ncbi:MAG: PEP-CTERM sorting domain-containing protein [Planctomycetaceae bacterium]
MRPYFFAVLLLLVTGPGARADLLLDLRYSDSTTSKTVLSGDTVTVDLILRDPSDDTFISTEGLGSGGGAIVVSGSAAVLPVGPVVEGPGFDPLFTAPGVAVPRPGLVNSVLLGPFLPFPAGLGTTDVLLASFSFIATGIAGDTATLSADVLDPAHILVGNETFASFTDLDSILTDLATTPGNFGSVTLTIGAAAVPEPSTLMTGLLVAGTLAWRRRKSAQPQ